MKRLSRRQKHYIVSLVVLVLIGTGGIVVIRKLSAPSQGTIEVQTPKVAYSPPVVSVQLQGKTATFSYPSNFSQVAAQPAGPPTIERYSFIKRQEGSWLLNIEVDSLPSGNLHYDSGYQSRYLNSKDYQLATLMINKVNIPVYADITTATYNKVAFLTHNGYVATVALNGGLPTDAAVMQSCLVNLLNSWQWR